MKLLDTLSHYFSYPYRIVADRLAESEKGLENVNFGSGKVVNLNGKKTAVYKDEQGKVTKLNPSCTHLGCIVEWDVDNRQWLCPCHLSKFKPKGEVIEGPAKKDLKSI